MFHSHFIHFPIFRFFQNENFSSETLKNQIKNLKLNYENSLKKTTRLINDIMNRNDETIFSPIITDKCAQKFKMS